MESMHNIYEIVDLTNKGMRSRWNDAEKMLYYIMLRRQGFFEEITSLIETAWKKIVKETVCTPRNVSKLSF